MKYSELIKKLEKSGCYLKRHGANHDIYYSPITNKLFTVGRHLKQEVATGTLKKILTDAGLQ